MTELGMRLGKGHWRECWDIVDSRTGRSVTITSYPSRWSAQAQIAAWRARDARGGRPDISDTMPHLKAVRVDHEP